MDKHIKMVVNECSKTFDSYFSNTHNSNIHKMKILLSCCIFCTENALL